MLLETLVVDLACVKSAGACCVDSSMAVLAGACCVESSIAGACCIDSSMAILAGACCIDSSMAILAGACCIDSSMAILAGACCIDSSMAILAGACCVDSFMESSCVVVPVVRSAGGLVTIDRPISMLITYFIIDYSIGYLFVWSPCTQFSLKHSQVVSAC